MENYKLKTQLRKDINAATNNRLSYEQRQNVVNDIYQQLTGLSDSDTYVDDTLGNGED